MAHQRTPDADGNSLPRLTLFDRIWLADNDYFKAPVKFHNSVTVFRDGQSAAIPPYAELVAAGESPRYGYSRTRLANYAGVDWTRTIFWLRQQQAFAVLDQLTALDDDEYQFRALWHGVGAAKLSDGGLLLTQKGLSLWVQIAPGPVLELHDDAELGANWSGYEHAEPVVRSLEAVSTVKLAKGESYLFASVLHGKSDGIADLDGDGKAEVICGTHYYWASVLNADGQRRWQYNFGPICYDIATGCFDRDDTRGVVFGSGDGKIHVVDASGKPRLAYTTGDGVKHVAAADLDGDGLDEILAGSLNYNLYCFGADAGRRWRRDLGGPVSALVTVPQQPGVLAVAGTGKGRLASVDATGRVRAVTELGSEILDLVAGRQSVIVATADGQLRKISAEPAGLGPRSD